MSDKRMQKRPRHRGIRQAIEIDPKDADLFLFRGLAHRWKGRRGDPARPFIDAVRVHRAETIALMNKPEFEQAD
jgi:hypothetical protein